MKLLFFIYLIHCRVRIYILDASLTLPSLHTADAMDADTPKSSIDLRLMSSMDSTGKSESFDFTQEVLRFAIRHCLPEFQTSVPVVDMTPFLAGFMSLRSTTPPLRPLADHNSGVPHC